MLRDIVAMVTNVLGFVLTHSGIETLLTKFEMDSDLKKIGTVCLKCQLNFYLMC